ncbi:DUF2652 domain-containing protein [Aquimarina sp. W85]|uniref:DUF2652 domain-containing protein n=1 Tax=Aquimarina rhodophyticola TaxID=3342246 RepID=UPI00366E4D74
MNIEPTLICIPDISGFTKFMSETDIEVSSKVIPSLLNQIIYSNEMGLKVSEIEGDAVLFFKSGELPSFKELITQCRLFYTRFYEKLHKLRSSEEFLEHNLNIPEILGLKIVLHYGEVGATRIGNKIKLIGEDIIVAHRLLKNSIPVDEYLLVSSSLMQQYDELDIERNFGWGTLIDMQEIYEHIGEIKYSYINLQPLTKQQN